VNYDDETLMAFADGELDEPLRAEISAAVERDPALARRVAQHRALRAQVAGAFSPVMDQPVPERLLGAARADAPQVARSGRVLQFPARSSHAAAVPWRAREWGAMAASVVLGALIAWKVFMPEPALLTARGGALLARGPLAAALDTQLASQQGGGEPVLIGLTFRGNDGHYCRSFVLRTAGTAGLACRVDGEWRVPVTAAAPGGEGMRQAASMPPEVLSAIGARLSGEALDAAAEQNALRGGWDAAPAR
jgi:hypothetical protein